VSEGRMVVGRSLWDFVIEVVRMPGFGIVLIALLILLEVILILYPSARICLILRHHSI